MKEYFIALKGNFAQWNALAESRRAEMLVAYGEWVQKLRHDGRLLYGSELSPNSRDLIPSQDQCLTVQGPYPETQETITGFFMIKAENMDDALEISQECPALRHGNTVSVIET